MKISSVDINGEIKNLLANDSLDDLVVDLLDEVSFLLSKKERRWWRCWF
jgi:hypothetical protein